MLSFIGKILFMVVSNFLIFFAIIILNSKLELGFSNLEMDVFILPFLLILNFFIAIPSLRKNFYKQFIKVKELHLLIALPILISIVVLFVVYNYMYLSIIFNNQSVSIGSNQYVASETLSNLGQLVLMGIVGPFTGEIIFRYLMLYLLPFTFLLFLYNERAMIKRIVTKSAFSFGNKIYKKMQKHSKAILTFWIILISSLFSLGHGPDLWSFPIYLLGGLSYSFLFIKYGFLSAWVAHGAFNVLSPIMNTVVLMFLGLFI